MKMDVRLINKKERLHNEAIGLVTSFNNNMTVINNRVVEILSDTIENNTNKTNDFFTSTNGVGKKAIQQIIELLETLKAYTVNLKDSLGVLQEEYERVG